MNRLAALLLGAALLPLGCGGARGPGVPQPPVLASAASRPGVELWTLPRQELRTQRIVRLRYEGPGDDGTLYLTLRLEREARYTLEAHARILGKSVFRLMVEDDHAIYLDLQRSEFCRFERSIEISAVPLGPLPFDVLPALLLGRVPARPDADGARLDDAGDWTFRDDRGRRWTISAADGLPSSWTLWKDDAPAVWWSHDDNLSYLSAREEELQLRWRAGRAQPLASEIAPPRIPEGFVPGTDCS